MRRLKRILTLFLATVMFANTPAETIGASPTQGQKYISEVVTSTAGSEEEAKKWLTDNKYTVVDHDLNKGTKEDFVYMGYKTTTNPKDAVTDIAVMDMKGGYSFTDYETMLENQKKDIQELVQSLKIILVEYKKNYDEGSPLAIASHDNMNRFIEDDSNMKMGDYLLQDSLSDDDLTKIMMQGSSIVLSSIYTYLTASCSDYGDKNWIERLSELGPDEDVMENPVYDLMAREIYKNWDQVQEELTYYKSTMVKLNGDEESIKKYVQTLSLTDLQKYTYGASLYDVIDGKKYGDETLMDLFTRNSDDLDIEELYPLVSVLNEVQQKCVSFGCFQTLILTTTNTKNAVNTADKATEEIEKSKEENVSKEETCSLYEGVDRSVFVPGGIALTSAAKRREASTGDPYVKWDAESISLLASTVVFTATFIGAIAATIHYTNMITAMKASADFYYTQLVAAKELGLAMPASASWKIGSKTALKYLHISQGVMAVALGLALICAGTYIGIQLSDYYNPSYTAIPRIMVDEVENDQGKKSYVYYNVVKDQDGNYTDLNARAGKQWNAVYVTKDSSAGKPILANVRVNTKNNVAPDDFTGLHYFGEKAAFNLNKHTYNDKVDGIYLFYEHYHGTTTSLNSSVFSNGGMIALSGCFGILGVIIATTVQTLRRKRKKQTLA